MADDDTTADPPAAGDTEQRLTRVENTLDKILGILSGDNSDPATPAGDGKQDPAAIGAEVRRQLEDRDRQAAAAADAKSKEDRLGAVEQRVAELGEKKPEPLPRRVEHAMGWR